MKKRAKRGMTFIEVIVSIAILGIITIAMLNMFTGGFIGIISAGKHTDVGYEAQQNMENAIYMNASAGADQMIIEFQGGPTITVLGSDMEHELNYGRHNITVNTFVPNP